MPKGQLYYKTKLKEKEKEIEILRSIAQTVNYNWNLKNILASVIEIVSDYTRSDSCFIYLIDDGVLTLYASQNPHRAELGKISIKKGEGITGWVASHKKTAVISFKAYEDERFKFFNKLPEDKYEAFLSVPIVFDSEVVGVINIQHKFRRKYEKGRIDFLEIIAQQVGGAIKNARLVTETNLLKEALQVRKLIDRAKAILIKQKGLTEPEAHIFLNKKSMDSRKSLKEVAEAVILMDGIEK